MGLKAILLILLGLIVAVAVAYGAIRWQAGTQALQATLEVERSSITPATYDPQELQGLPAPVMLTAGQPMVAAASIRYEGQFNMSEEGEKWVPFTSTQLGITERPGFDWDARIRMAPGINVLVHDAYVAGEGLLHAALFGLVTLAELRGTPEMA